VPAVSVGIVTWNSASYLERTLAAIRAQTVPLQLLVVDNASTDGTRDLLERLTGPGERRLLDRNTGFSAGHNLAIRHTHGHAYLALNPDVFLEPDCVAILSAALEALPAVGAVGPVLRRAMEAGRVDSAGIVMRPSQRHVDRGQDETDRGQFEEPCDVFGVTGACALYRRRMLDEVAVDGEIFDEDFFAYREDADLAWRCQLLGWRAVVVPRARAFHVRRVTPERRRELPASINRWSVRNRFLLRIKNQTPRHALTFAMPALVRDLQVVGYVLTQERSSLGGLADVVRLWPRIWRKRRWIMRRRVAREADVARWFREPSRPLPADEQARLEASCTIAARPPEPSRSA
jgi:GT2 family glycosyltransferase